MAVANNTVQVNHIDMNSLPDYDVIIVGGGLGGLVSSILLSRSGINVLLIEKKTYPYHKVCGEYVSNEVLTFLKSIGFNPFQFGASSIHKLRISTPSGKNIYTKLKQGGFGLSRYKMDEALAELATQKGATVLTNTRVNDIVFNDSHFEISTQAGNVYTSRLVIGSYGKRDTLDKKLNRSFINYQSGYMGVKYHIKSNYPIDEIGLDTFENGYCGIVKIEDDKYNLCYLYRRGNGKTINSINQLQEEIMCNNPRIKTIFNQSTFINKEPEVINEVSFRAKATVENHVLMCGDSAGLITPLCGNGMSMAIHAAKILNELIISSSFLKHPVIPAAERVSLEHRYTQQWNRQFKSRLTYGRMIQSMFGNKLINEISLRSIHVFPPLERWLISRTHGKEIL